MPSDPLYIRINHAAVKFGVSKSVLQRWVAAGKLVAYRPTGKLTLLKLADIVALVEGHSVAQAQPA
jgi:excisionase family DNA binding protein